MPRSWKCRQKCSWNHCHRKSNWFSIGDIAAVYLTCFDTHLGDQWMRFAPGRCRASVGRSTHCGLSSPPRISIQWAVIVKYIFMISNATGHMWRQVLHPSNCYIPNGESILLPMAMISRAFLSTFPATRHVHLMLLIILFSACVHSDCSLG